MPFGSESSSGRTLYFVDKYKISSLLELSITRKLHLLALFNTFCYFFSENLSLAYTKVIIIVIMYTYNLASGRIPLGLLETCKVSPLLIEQAEKTQYTHKSYHSIYTVLGDD